MKRGEYELLVQAIFQQLHDQDAVPNFIVEHDVVKQGTTTKHQIDVYWEFTRGGITYRSVVQAKNWAHAVDKGEVLKFEAVVRDLPGQPRGIMVSANGYQRGAREVATACGIAIYELKLEQPSSPIMLTDTGWARLMLKGYRKTVAGEPLGLVVETEIVTPEFSGVIFQADPAWVRDNDGIVPSISELRFLPHEIEFRDAEQRIVRTLRHVYQEMAQDLDRRGQMTARQARTFDGPNVSEGSLRLASGEDHKSIG